MPYEWSDAAPVQPRGEAPVALLRLWPHRSLPRPGFAGFFAGTAALAALPLVAMLGSPVMWGLLPFEVLVLAGLWWAIQSTYRSGEVEEEMRLWPDRVTLVRRERTRQRTWGERTWEANPHWVRTAIHREGGPVRHYLTLSGAGRTVEIGAFLSEEERIALRPEIEAAFAEALARVC